MATGEAKQMTIKHKTVAQTSDDMEFVLSDNTPDRYGDVVEARGWVLDNFKNNPIALFNHNPNFPLGRWKNLRVEGNALKGELVMAPEGASARIDEIRALMKAGILRAVSVGFRPLEAKPRGKGFNGEIFVKQELVETSLVSVPANPNALAVAKSLHVSDETVSMVFGEQANKDSASLVTRSTGEHADSRRPNPKTGAKAMTLAERIAATQENLNKLNDQLGEVSKNFDESNPDDANMAAVEEISNQIETAKKSLATLKRAEATLAMTSRSVEEGAEGGNEGNESKDGKDGNNQTIVRSAQPARPSYGKRPFAVPAKKLQPADYMFRSLTVLVKHHFEKNKRPIDSVLMDTYGEDVATKSVMDIITRAATAPAMTTTTGWAAELVTTAIGDFMEALRPSSVFAALSPRGTKFTFGRNGIISLPARANTPTIAGSFVAQGAPIPVRQAAFSAITLTPKKMAVISTFTREIAEHSTPAIEGLIRQAIIEDTSVAVDSVLLDANAATATRPAGILNGVTPGTATAITGGAFSAVVGDLRLLSGALITSTQGNVRNPVWLMNPADALAVSLTSNAGGDLPFRDEIARGTLLGYPLITSTSVPVDTMLLLDAADFISVTGDDPRFDVSDQATLHMEDTTPLALNSGTPANPIRSLWQTDTLGIRMIMDMNWAMRRTGMVASVTGMTWNA